MSYVKPLTYWVIYLFPLRNHPAHLAVGSAMPARRLAEAGPDAVPMHATINKLMAAGSPKKSRILEALRRSPLAHADLNLKRPHIEGRKVDM